MNMLEQLLGGSQQRQEALDLTRRDGQGVAAVMSSWLRPKFDSARR